MEGTRDRHPEARAVEALLCEIVDAFRARGLLTRGDIAGAFFRADFVLKCAAAGDRTIFDAPVILANFQDYWQKRMTFQPELAALEHRRKAWLSHGGQGPDPANAQEIVRIYDDALQEEAEMKPRTRAQQSRRKRTPE